MKTRAGKLLESLKKRRSFNEAHLSLEPELTQLFESKNIDEVMNYFQPLIQGCFEEALEEARNPTINKGWNNSDKFYKLTSLLGTVQRINSSILEYEKVAEEDKATVSIRLEDALEEAQRILASWKAGQVRGNVISPVA